MKKYLFIACLFVQVFSFCCADEIIWKGTPRDDATGKAKVGSWLTSGSWFGGAIPNEIDDVLFSYDAIKDTTSVGTDGSVADIIINTSKVTVNNLTITGSKSPFNRIDNDRNCTLTVNGDFLRTGAGDVGFSGGMTNSLFSISIAGNVTVGSTLDSASAINFGGTSSNAATNWNRPLEYLEIGGDVMLYNYAKLRFNVEKFSGTSSKANPDVYIAGVIKSSSNIKDANPEIVWLRRDGAGDATTYISVEGINANFANMKNDGLGTGNYLSVIVLRNENGQTYNAGGYINESGSGFSSTSKIRFVKEGTGVQKFTGKYQRFSGGVEVYGGSVLMSGVSEQSSSSHGNLTVSGGTFGFVSGHLWFGEDMGQGTFGFDNIYWKNGSLLLNVGTGGINKIVLTGTIHSLESTFESVFFDFIGDMTILESMTDYVKIVEWGQKTSLTKDDFSALAIAGYEADFDIRDDGLYLKYIAVPEPAFYAIIFGALALILVYRRR